MSVADHGPDHPVAAAATRSARLRNQNSSSSLLPDLYPLNREDTTSIAKGTTEMETSSSSADTRDPVRDGRRLPFDESFVSLYLPLLWQSLWGTMDVVRTLLLTHVLQAYSKPEESPEIKVYRTFVNAFSSYGSSWPPPPLLFLALFTIVTLLVHPEGFTWIALRKMKSGLMYLFESSSTCWAWVINDFGSVVSTVLALAVFVALFFLCYLLHRTLRPRRKLEASSTASTQATDKSKRKRRKGRNEKSRPGSSHKRNATPSSPTQQQDSDAPSCSSSQRTLGQQETADIAVTIPDRNESNAAPRQPPCSSVDHDESGMALAKSNDNRATEGQPRARVESASTVDTSIDASLEEASVGSMVSDRSASKAHDEVVRSSLLLPSGRAPSRKNRGVVPGQRNPTTTRGRKSAGSNGTNAVKKNSVPLVPVRRWDALKPREQHGQSSVLSGGDAYSDVCTNGRKGRNKGSSRSQRKNGKTRKERDSRQSYPGSSDHPVSTDAGVLTPPVLDRSTAKTSWVEDDSTTGNTNYHVLATGHADHPSAVASAPTTESRLNPNSPPFAPSVGPTSNTPLPPPPPGLHALGKATAGLPRMEPLQLPSSPPPGLSSVPGLTLPSGSTSPLYFRARDNPFADDDDDDYDDEEQIAAELQELGGQMVGSILDF